MPKTNRPPLAAARTEATKALIELHKEEHELLMGDWLAEHGWARETVTVEKWINETNTGSAQKES